MTILDHHLPPWTGSRFQPPRDLLQLVPCGRCGDTEWCLRVASPLGNRYHWTCEWCFLGLELTVRREARAIMAEAIRGRAR